MKTVNARIFAIKHKLFTILDKSLKADKNAIKEGAKITFENYCKIQAVECTKTTLDKTKVQKLCNKYGIDIATLENTTEYIRIDIDNVPTEVNTIVDNIINTLEDSNDKNIKRVANKVASKNANIK